MFLKLYYYLIVSCAAYPEIADETCPLKLHTHNADFTTKIPGSLYVMYSETGLVPTGVLNPFRSIYTSYPDLVHLLCVTRSTALRPLNGPSAFSHEPLIHRTPIMWAIYTIIFFFFCLFLIPTTKRHHDIYLKLLPMYIIYCRVTIAAAPLITRT